MTMLRQSPRRIQRATSFKMRNGFHICLCLAIFIWLLYHAKHIYDKKKAHIEISAKVSDKLYSGNEILKPGRKNLLNGRHGEIGREMEKLTENIPRVREDPRTAAGDDGSGPDRAEDEENDGDEEEEVESEEGEDLIDEEDKDMEEESEEQEN